MKTKIDFTGLINRVVACRWRDIVSYDVENLDSFVKTEAFERQCYIFQTFGKLIGEDNICIAIAPTLCEKNPFIKERKATVYSIPKSVVLEIKEIDFVREGSD